MRSRLELTKVAKEISVFSKNLWELLKPVQKAFVTLIMLMLFIQLARLLDPWLLSKILDFIKNHVEHIQIDRQLQWDLALLILAYTGLYAGLDLIDHVKRPSPFGAPQWIAIIGYMLHFSQNKLRDDKCPHKKSAVNYR